MAILGRTMPLGAACRDTAPPTKEKQFVRSPLPRIALAAATAAVISLSALPADAGTKSFSPLDGAVIEKTTLVPAAGSVTAYTVPSDKRVKLTRFCGDGCVRCEGEILGSKVFTAREGRCVVHPQGVHLPPGETVRCTNSCPTMKAALFSGVLEQ